VTDSHHTSELPKGWAWTELGEIAIEINSGFPSGRWKRGAENGVPHLRPMNIATKGKIDLADVKYVQAEGYDALSKGDVVFNNTNSPELLGKTAYIREDTNWAYSNHMTRIRFVPSLMEPAFIGHYLHFLFRNGYFKTRCVHHVNQASIGKDFLSKMRVPFPPSSEQKRVVTKLEELFACVDAGVEGLRKVKVQLKRYRQAVLKYAFEGKLTEEWRKTHIDQIEPAKGLLERVKQKEASNQEPSPMKKSDLFTLPKDWIWTVFGEISRINMGQSPSGSSYNNSGHGTPLLNGPTEFGEEYPVAVQWTTSPVKICKKGDLLICVRGNTTGRMNWADQEYCIGRGLAAITPLENIVKRELLFSFLLMKVEEIMRRTRGSTFPNLKSDELHKFPFPLAAYTEQEELVVRIGEAFSAARELERNMATSFLHSERLRQSILKASFEGELVPPDPSDEPAEKLLERVKAERAKAMGEKDTNRRRKNMSKQLELSTYVK